MKIVFFLEGDSEEHLVTSLLRKHFYSYKITSDVRDFLTNPNSNCAYLLNCGSMYNIAPEVNNLEWVLQNNDIQRWVVICDLDNLVCNTERMNWLATRFNQGIPKDKGRYCFFLPTIEAAYFHHPVELIAAIQRITGHFPSLDANQLASLDGGTPLKKLQLMFKREKLAFRKAKTAEEVFSRIDMQNSPNAAIQRFFSNILVTA